MTLFIKNIEPQKVLKKGISANLNNVFCIQAGSKEIKCPKP